jgi:hypothetical protein
MYALSALSFRTTRRQHAQLYFYSWPRDVLHKHRGPYPWSTAAGRQAERLPLSNVVKNKWSYTSNTPHAFMVHTGTILPSTIVHQVGEPVTWVLAAWAPRP